MALKNKNKRKSAVPSSLLERKHILSDESPFAVQEAYKTLRTNLIFSAAGEGCKVILVTSPDQGEAKSTTAMNVAIAFARNKDKVLLIDCDLRMPTIAQKLELRAAPGLTDFLVGQSPVSETVRVTSSGMHVMPAGTVPPNPSELLGSENMKKLIAALRKHYDYIILDTPPVSLLTDAVVLSPVCDGVVLVSRQGQSSYKNMHEAVRRLEFAQARLLGFVMTDVKSEKKGGGHYKKYGYGYGYEKAAKGNTRTGGAPRSGAVSNEPD